MKFQTLLLVPDTIQRLTLHTLNDSHFKSVIFAAVYLDHSLVNL